jgi:hypothetical protein
MTHTLDIGTDLDDLLATIGDLTTDAPLSPSLLAAARTAATSEPVALLATDPAAAADERPSLISPKVMRGVWYR